MRAIRHRNHHRKHSEPCQVLPFFVKLQSHKCWKHCSHWVLSEVPIFQRDPPLKYMEQPVGNQRKCRCELDVCSPRSYSWCSSPDRELYWNGTCWDRSRNVAVAELCFPGLWLGGEEPKPQGWFREHSQGSLKPAASQRITVSNPELQWGRKGGITRLLALPHIAITMLFLQLLEIFSAQQWICWINGSVSAWHPAPKPFSVLPRQARPGLGTVWHSETEGFSQGLCWKSQYSISHVILWTPCHCFQDK